MNKNKGGGRTKNNQTALEQVMNNFLPCGRCSFFLTGYRVIHGHEGLEAAAGSSQEGWLELPWNYETRHLVQKSYGSHLDVELYYYDSRCPECQRRFIYRAAEQEGKHETFCIELEQS